MKLLRPFQYDPEHTDPDEVAQHNDDYIPERAGEYMAGMGYFYKA